MMSKRVPLGIAALALAGAFTAAYVWRAHVRERQGAVMIGTWEIRAETDPEEAVQSEIARVSPDVAVAVGERFRSSQRIRFDRNGTCRHAMNLPGTTVTAEGTWRVAERFDAYAIVNFRKQKVSVKEPNGEAKVEVREGLVQWKVTVVDRDRMVLMAVDEDGPQSYELNRVKE